MARVGGDSPTAHASAVQPTAANSHAPALTGANNLFGSKATRRLGPTWTLNLRSTLETTTVLVPAPEGVADSLALVQMAGSEDAAARHQEEATAIQQMWRIRLTARRHLSIQQVATALRQKAPHRDN